MRLISKSACLVACFALSNFGQALAAYTTRDVAITAVAMGRMCAEWKPEMNYSLQNLMSLPEFAPNADLKKEIAEVENNPAFQDEIREIQMRGTGDELAIRNICPSYAPVAK